MAGSLNRVSLIGNVGKDPEVRTFQNGGKVVNFSLATAETWKDKNTGEKKEKTDWHTIAVFQEGLTNVAEQYIRKGSKVMVEGKLQTRKWQDQQGQDRYSTEVVLQGPDARILLLGDKGGSSGGGEPRGRVEGADNRSGNQANNEGRRAYAAADLDDDVPF